MLLQHHCVRTVSVNSCADCVYVKLAAAVLHRGTAAVSQSLLCSAVPSSGSGTAAGSNSGGTAISITAAAAVVVLLQALAS
jgi:hypothetical protein